MAPYHRRLVQVWVRIALGGTGQRDSRSCCRREEALQVRPEAVQTPLYQGDRIEAGVAADDDVVVYGHGHLWDGCRRWKAAGRGEAREERRVARSRWAAASKPVAQAR